MKKITERTVSNKMKVLERKALSNKHEWGNVLICAGSFGMAGAAVMAGHGALKGGSGLVTYYVNRDIIPILQTSLPQAMCIDIEEEILLSKYDSIAIGPGLLTDLGEKRLHRFLRGYGNNLIIDAESLNVLARSDTLYMVKERVGGTVLTPHEGEMARLLGVSGKAVKEDRIGAARQLWEKTKATVVLKGYETIVITEKGDEYCNSTGNPGLATGGTGDVLTGLIAAFASQGMDSKDAAICAVYVHGKAGDKCAKAFGEISMNAMDVAHMIGPTIKKIME